MIPTELMKHNKKIKHPYLHTDNHIILEDRENKYSFIKLIIYQSDK